MRYYPIYSFVLDAVLDNATESRTAKPIWGAGMTKDYSRQDGEWFFRAALSGSLKFVRDDYEFIMGKAFETEFRVTVNVSDDGGKNWRAFWKGRFWRTDCEIDEDDRVITVEPEVMDEYTDILEGMDNEYDLITLCPEIVRVSLDKRPMVQVYSPGESVVACFLSGMYWEQNCTAISDKNDLVRKYYFVECKGLRSVNVSGNIRPLAAKQLYYGRITGDFTQNYSYTTGEYKFVYTFSATTGSVTQKWEIVRVADSVAMWRYTVTGTAPTDVTGDITLTPIDGTGAYGDAVATIARQDVFMRLVCDVYKVGDVDTYPIPDDDMVGDNRNYRRCVGYDFEDTLYFTDKLVSTPTKYGIYQPGQYYTPPYVLGVPAFYPIAKSTWGRISAWFAFSAVDEVVEPLGRKAYVLKDAYPLWSVVSVLLGQIAPGIGHQGTDAFSQVLYGSNPLGLHSMNLLLTQKSNILAGNYDRPAQKAPVTLRKVLDMLRDCFRCYWFVDVDASGEKRFRIEHVSWFMNGGSYSSSPNVGTDLTAMTVTRNGKPWAFDTSKYKFDKSDMPERYEFGWMDDVTLPFDGNPMEIMSRFVDKGKIESVTVGEFTSDIDYMLLNPSSCSEDGFALMDTDKNGDGYVVPYMSADIGDVTYVLQNPYVSFWYLQRYYLYDLPASRVKLNGVKSGAYGTTRNKVQDVSWPCPDDPNIDALVRTNLGVGHIEELSLSLSTREAKTELRYDTTV